jgi:hypothetical protein
MKKVSLQKNMAVLLAFKLLISSKASSYRGADLQPEGDRARFRERNAFIGMVQSSKIKERSIITDTARYHTDLASDTVSNSKHAAVLVLRFPDRDLNTGST